MLKRIIPILLVLSALALIALAPMNRNQAPENSAKLQVTVVVTVGAVEPTPSSDSAPVAGIPTSTMIILGLLVLLGIAIVIGGMALMSRRA